MSPLPDDILRLVFDDLDLAGLVAASHVSQTWRMAAHGHPTFSRDIRYIHHDEIDPPPASADFLSTRALATSGLVTLEMYMSSSSVFAKDVVLRLVSLCLHRLEDLRIVLHISLCLDMINVLEHPAPRLKYLRFEVVPQSEPGIWTLSPSFLGGSAPLLHTLFTSGFTCVPGTSFLPGFSTTKHLCYEPPCFGAAPAFILRTMLGLLPNLESLHIIGHIDWADGDIWDSQSLSTPLRMLELGACNPTITTVHFAGALSSRHTRRITLNAEIGADVFELMVSSLAGALGLSIAWHPMDTVVGSTWFLQLTDADGHERQLQFSEAKPQLASNVRRVVPMLSPLADRLTRVTVDIALWEHAAELVPQLSNLETLALSLHRPRPDYYPISSVKWPRLKTIIISTPLRAPVDVLWLAKFMGHTLGCVARRKLKFHLVGCQLDGDPELVWGYFDEIKLLRA